MEPVTIGTVVLGTAFAIEGIKFLWKQADTIVNRYNDRKYKQLDERKERAETELAKLETAGAPAFLALPPEMKIDFDRAEEKAAKLTILSEALTPYVSGEKSPDAADENLKGTLDTLQRLVEYVLHQPLQIDEQVRRNIVEAKGGGKIEIGENFQRVEEPGENVIRADGAGSSVKIGRNEQIIE